MNNRPLQPGDLCLIIGWHPSLPTNQCNLVEDFQSEEVVCYQRNKHIPIRFSERMWNVFLLTGQKVSAPERLLMRIDGHKEPEKLKTEEGIEA